MARYYVEPRCQHHNPADYNEIEAISYVRSPAFETINNFLNREFLLHDGRQQLFVLADAGMGKTSLLVMIRMSHLTSFWPKRYECELLKLGPSTLKDVEAIPSKSNTVLLLDALDEDQEGFGRVEERLVEILTATERFRRVIISCRTQYFPSGGEEDPFDRPGRVEVSGFLCPIIFLSLFDNEQVDLYLDKRFPGSASEKRAKSREILSNMKSLRFRPLLLAHIEDILSSDEVSWTEFAIYRALVQSWLRREQLKSRRQSSHTLNISGLMKACSVIAVSMHNSGKRRISIDELGALVESVPEVAHLDRIDVGGRSLLNRNSKGEFRFSHLTMQEFLLANLILSGRSDVQKDGLRITDQIIRFLSSAEAQIGDLTTLNFTDCDLTPLSLAGTDLDSSLLTGARLKGVNAAGASMREVDAVDVDLSGADLSNTDLSGANLRASNLANAKLRNARLDGADLSGACLEGADLSGAKCVKTLLQGVVLDSVNLSGADLTGASLQGATLRRQKSSNIIFRGATLRGVDAEAAEFGSCDLRHADLTGANLSRACIAGASLPGVRLQGATLDGVDFRTIDLEGVDLREVDLSSAIVSRVSVRDLITQGGGLKDVDLSQYDLRFADLSGADAQDANFGNADLFQSIFFRSDLSGADLSSAKLTETDFTCAYYSEQTRFPEGFSPYREGLIRK